MVQALCLCGGFERIVMEDSEPATAVEALFSRLDANIKGGKHKKSLKTVDESEQTLVVRKCCRTRSSVHFLL